MSIPAILILAGEKTYGRTKQNVLIYKCIPDNHEISPMLVPYKMKTMGFSKVFSNLYVIIARKHENNEKYGVLTNVIGPVNCLNSFYEYQIICKQLNISLTQLTKSINKQKINQNITFTKEWKTKYSIQDCLSDIVYTIDPSGCADFDDAFSIKVNEENQCILTIYIANVPVILDTYSLWQTLSDRVATIYLPQGLKRSMLPPILSEGLCSLKSGEDRVAFAMEFRLDSASILAYTRHFNCIINVNRNFVYEEPCLLQNSNYQLLQRMLPHIKDTHEMVAHMMLAMNAESAKLLINKECGIFRTVTRTASKDTNVKYTDEISKYISNWKCMHGQYTGYNPDTTTSYHHAALNLDAYAHITSPIRRLVDTINMSLLSLNLDLTNGLYEKWLNHIDHLNKQMKSVQKVQNICTLLEKVTNNPDILHQSFTGYIFSNCNNNNNYNIVYIPELNITSKFTVLQDKFVDLTKPQSQDQFKIFLFSDEFNILKKIRIMQI